MTEKEVQPLKPTRLREPRWLMLAGLAVLAIDLGLTTWGMHRDSQWNTTVLGLCKNEFFRSHLPPLPENGWIGWAALCTIGPAVLAVLIVAVRLSRRSRNVGAIIAASVVTAVATLAAFWLLLVGLLMIEPRSIGTGTDGSGLPCGEG